MAKTPQATPVLLEPTLHVVRVYFVAVAFSGPQQQTQIAIRTALVSKQIGTACFWKTTATLDAPNFYAYSHAGSDITSENAKRFKPPAACWSLAVGMRPKSRGAIRLTGPDPYDPVRIDANYLRDPQDLQDLMTGLSTAREIGNSIALRSFTGREIIPGSLNEEDLGRVGDRAHGRSWRLRFRNVCEPRCSQGFLITL
jgi:choline dehydrogenase-like flavoprotein